MNTPYPGVVENGQVYDFGIPRIDFINQKNHIELALSHEDISPLNHEAMAQCQKNRAKFSNEKGELRPETKAEFFQTPHVIGYCSSPECKKNGIFSLDSGGYVVYNCLDCLAQKMIISRENSVFASIFINFTYKGTKEETPIDGRACKMITMSAGNLVDNAQNKSLTPPLRIVLDEKGKLLHGPDKEFKRLINGKWTKSPPNFQEQGHSFVLTVSEKVQARPNEPNSYLTGFIACQIYGKYVCENVLKGGNCESLNFSQEMTEFAERSIPRGYAGWKEVKKPDEGYHGSQIGEVITHKQCLRCIFKKRPSSITKGKSQSASKKPKNTKAVLPPQEEVDLFPLTKEQRPHSDGKLPTSVSTRPTATAIAALKSNSLPDFAGSPELSIRNMMRSASLPAGTYAAENAQISKEMVASRDKTIEQLVQEQKKLLEELKELQQKNSTLAMDNMRLRQELFEQRTLPRHR